MVAMRRPNQWRTRDSGIQPNWTVVIGIACVRACVIGYVIHMFIKKRGVLKATDLFTLQVADTMYKPKENKLPTILKSYFYQNDSVHSYNTRNTRNSPKYPVSYCRSRYTCRKRSRKLSGLKVGNFLPSYITASANINIYKRKWNYS